MSVYLFHVVLYFSCKNLLLPKKTAFLYWARCASTSTENSVFLRCCSSLMRAKQRACCCSRFSITLFTFVQNYSAQALPINDIYALTGRWLQFSGERNKERKKKNTKKPQHVWSLTKTCYILLHSKIYSYQNGFWYCYSKAVIYFRIVAILEYHKRVYIFWKQLNTISPFIFPQCCQIKYLIKK